jgi:hypothetical protein
VTRTTRTTCVALCFVLPAGSPMPLSAPSGKDQGCHGEVDAGARSPPQVRTPLLFSSCWRVCEPLSPAPLPRAAKPIFCTTRRWNSRANSRTR